MTSCSFETRTIQVFPEARGGASHGDGTPSDATDVKEGKNIFALVPAKAVNALLRIDFERPDFWHGMGREFNICRHAYDFAYLDTFILA